MSAQEHLEQQLQRWVGAGLLDSQSAERIRSFETSHESPGMRWPVVFAIAFGSIMVAAGILLFVAAHWEDLSPAERFLLAVAIIAGFHLSPPSLMPHLRALAHARHSPATLALT